ncbi:mCG1026626 [Mus musculus]|nr:mCG1026626 [Mus musculus]
MRFALCVLSQNHFLNPLRGGGGVWIKKLHLPFPILAFFPLIALG